MKPKLKPRIYARQSKYQPIVDFRKLEKLAAGLVSEKRADKFAFDLMEVDRACSGFRTDMVQLLKALRIAKRDSTELRDASHDVAGTLQEFRKHGRRALLVLDTLARLARQMPPLDKATDLQLTERALAPFDKLFPPTKGTPKRARSARKTTGKKISAPKRAKKKKTPPGRKSS